MNNSVSITVIGVGGGGGNMVDHISKYTTYDINLVASNTDIQVLEKSLAKTTIQLGKVLTKGLGAGMKPDVGEKSAIESESEIKEALTGSDIVFITAGMGGGTGTGAAPVVAKIAKDLGALTIAVVTTPFKFEGRKRTKFANEGLARLQENADSIITIQNEKLLETIEKNLGIKEAFLLVDSVLSKAVNGISSVIIGNETSDINLDFADFKTIMTHPGDSLMTLGEGKGDTASEDGIEDALYSPLLGDIDINNAKGALIHFEINSEYPLMNLGMSMNIIEDKISEEADIIFGTTINDELALDEVKVTLVISGIKEEDDDTAESIDYDGFVKPKKTLKTMDDVKKLHKPEPEVFVDDAKVKESKALIEKAIESTDDLDVPTFMRNCE